MLWLLYAPSAEFKTQRYTVALAVSVAPA